MRPATGRMGRLAALAAAGAIALAGCGGGGEDATGSSGATTAEQTARDGTASTPPPADPSSGAASQQLVDLVNDYAATLSDVQGGTLGPAELRQSAARLRRGADAVVAKVEAVAADACVERLALGQADLMDTVAGFLQAAADGDAEGAAKYSEELKAADQAAMLREAKRCQDEVGYTGPESG